MKILVLASYPQSILNFRWDLIQSLLYSGLEVHIAAPSFKECKNDFLFLQSKGCIIHEINFQRTGLNPFLDMVTLIKVYSLMIKISPNYVLSYTIKPVIYGSLAASLAKVPYVYSLITGLGYAFQCIDKKYSFKRTIHYMVRFLYTLALVKNSCVFFQNYDDELLFRNLGILNSCTTSKVINGSGINLDQYNNTPLPMTNHVIEPHFLLIARLLGDKGVREYVQAAKIIKAKYGSIQFDLVGWIDDNPSAIKQTELRAWVDDGTVNFLGRLADVRPAISNCSIYVLPSYREGTPRTVLEAMAMGRPIITTDTPGCRETVVDGYNGFLVPVKSVEGLVEAMEKFIFNKSLIAEMGKASRLLAEEKYDVNKVNQFMLREMEII